MLRIIAKRVIFSSYKRRMIQTIWNYMRPQVVEPSRRTYSTNNKEFKEEQINDFDPKVKSIIHQLDGISPRFVMKKDDIQILTHPVDFYETLKQKISQAKKRVFLSSLYIGKSQYELAECIEQSLANNEDLKVSILVDALRGTREAPNSPCSASLLYPLVEKFGKHRIDIRMYHTPHLKGLAKWWYPKRYNESWGVQHMKLYGFDDEIILSGANLSHDYFTDRQDRYYIFRNKHMTDYFFNIHNAVSSLSYQLLPSSSKPEGFRLTWPTSNASCEPHMNLHRFLSDSSYLLEPLLKQHALNAFEEYDDTDKFDTIVYPISQLTPLFHQNNDISTEKPSILRLLACLDTPKVKWWFTAGYFNMLQQIQDRLINGKAKGCVITAAPQANSFYQSPGLSYYVPELYLLCAKKFLEEVKLRGKDSQISLYEWKKGIVNKVGGWSFHAKGLWITSPNEEEPTITVIGSSNYTKRAYSLDLEANAIIITKDASLKKQMKNEIHNLLKNVERLELSDFEPKVPAENLAIVDGSDETASAEKLSDANDKHYKISRRAQFALKVLGGSL
ncbi:Piso0_001584 [Millerozyma farinosa CBS 7064]|uniref:CDP-diacylglycerol--glycerol-3-phosphate 3-phosphatidyltransferase n=1 Tax=Pichia sorbitophila (strain ATCC MYA-4447 / BCRC 22081 / CBS 7064 / NBRC 10061 / NRRL Y-12695) TaxID=559304 RepID=G8YL68_PICSO|nr:Piso0_001584 [Millerozyma farinosa CBS 7064]